MSEIFEQKQIVVNQALHGYSDGHRLIASSVKLSKPSQRLMLILSDLSGPNIKQEFMSYLTGYPLKDDKCYALSRTWYADEMERPGCVWTHTLIVDYKYLCSIRDLGILSKYFYRPKNESSLDAYNDTIKIEGSRGKHHHFGVNNNLYGNILRHLIFSLYGDSHKKPIVLPADSPETYENLIMSVWSQQWSELRMNFTFCTGALSSRKINADHFAIQIVPYESVRSFERENRNALILNENQMMASLSGYPKWVQLASENIMGQYHENLNEFIFAFGDSKGDRSNFSKLVRIYKTIDSVNNNSADFSSLFTTIHDCFPRKNEGIAFKKSLFEESLDINKWLTKSVKEIDVLFQITTTNHYKMFTLSGNLLNERVKSLWSKNAADAKQLFLLLTKTEINPLGEEIIKAYSKAISPTEIELLADDNYGLYNLLVNLNPRLAVNERIWKLPVGIQLELLDSIEKSDKNMTHEDAKTIITNIINSSTGEISEKAYHVFGGNLIGVLLQWYNNNPKTSPKKIDRWLCVLDKNPLACLEWLSKCNEVSPSVVAAISSRLNPYSKEVQDYGIGVWLKTLEVLDSQLDPEIHRTIAEFLLPLSLLTSAPKAEKLANFSFNIIYDALAKSDLSYSAWLRLEPLLPKLPWYNSWDKCKRLQKGIKKKGFKFDEKYVY